MTTQEKQNYIDQKVAELRKEFTFPDGRIDCYSDEIEGFLTTVLL